MHVRGCRKLSLWDKVWCVDKDTNTCWGLQLFYSCAKNWLFSTSRKSLLVMVLITLTKNHPLKKRPSEWRVKWSCCIKRANQIDTYTLNWLKIPKWIRQSGWHNSFSWEIPAKMHFWLFKSNCCQPQRQDQCDFSFTGRSNKEHGV